MQSAAELEQFRHQCEVRWLLRLGASEGKAATTEYLGKIRAKSRRKQLEQDAKRQWGLGNRGKENDWR